MRGGGYVASARACVRLVGCAAHCAAHLPLEAAKLTRCALPEHLLALGLVLHRLGHPLLLPAHLQLSLVDLIELLVDL